MRESRITEEQIAGIVREHEAGGKTEQTHDARRAAGVGAARGPTVRWGTGLRPDSRRAPRRPRSRRPSRRDSRNGWTKEWGQVTRQLAKVELRGQTHLQR